ncbi:MAG: hypothetical protein ACTSR8_18875 [Promethearchaeota archaeon]
MNAPANEEFQVLKSSHYRGVLLNGSLFAIWTFLGKMLAQFPLQSRVLSVLSCTYIKFFTNLKIKVRINDRMDKRREYLELKKEHTEGMLNLSEDTAGN